MRTASDIAGAGVRELAVLGSPIAHSQSPALHRAAYAVLGLPWSYSRAEVVPDALGGYVASRPGSWRGLSLTMPLKQSVLPLVASLDETARLTGAANTVLFETDDAGRRVLYGFNTDVPGIVRALRAAGTTRADNVLVLGGGATAASTVVAAAQLGAGSVTVHVREPARAYHLVRLGGQVGLRTRIGRFGDDLAEHPGLVVSTLPGGAGGDDLARRALSGPALAEAAHDGVLLLEVAYDPWPTSIVEVWSRLAGAPTGVIARNVLSGLAMLVHQALLQVRIFVAGDPELELPAEPSVLSAMLSAAGLDASGRRR